MNWATERYVRLFTRKTASTAMWTWQARALWPWLLAACDRSGDIVLGKHGVRGLIATVELPAEIVEPGLACLLDDGCVVATPEGLRVPNFIEAQETKSEAMTAAERKALQRARDAAKVPNSRESHESHDVTIERDMVTDVTDDVTASRMSLRAVPCGAVPCGTESQKHSSAGADVPAVESEPSGPKPEDLQAAWNEHEALPKWREVTGKRRKAAKARLRERALDGPDGWREVIRRIAASRFCTGGGEQGWRASPDWLLQPDTATKVLEGAYDGAGPPKRDGPKEPRIPKVGSVEEALRL